MVGPSMANAQCEPTPPVPKPTANLVNERCTVDTDCYPSNVMIGFNPVCSSGVCANFNGPPETGAASNQCTTTMQCTFGYYCSIPMGESQGECAALIANGQACGNNEQCNTSAFCIGSNPNDLNKVCTPYYSLPMGAY
jgi:hypothetical protein